MQSMTAVLMLFLIPVGGGIPAGVLLARARGIGWPMTAALYFISDVILACTFEPLLRLMRQLGRRVAFLGRLAAALRQAMIQTASLYGKTGGPLTLIMVAFGVDPMTGRAATALAGHGFLSGWALAIAGDMLYFLLVMASTLWLNSILGDGTWTMIIILFLMVVMPPLLRRLRKVRRPKGSAGAEVRRKSPDRRPR